MENTQKIVSVRFMAASIVIKDKASPAGGTIHLLARQDRNLFALIKNRSRNGG